MIALHVDQSVEDAQDGYRYTAITAGAHKNDYSPHEPLHDAVRAALQAEVDRLHALFVAHVAAMRGLDEAAVRATEAALFFGPQAVETGLADGVATLVQRLQRSQEIPIAVLVRRVDLKRRFDLAAGAQRALPALARAIERELGRL